MPTCVVPGCTSGYKSNPDKFHFFTIPRDCTSLELWKRAVKRNDVKSGQSVCDNHFPKSQIVWQRYLLGDDGRVLGVSSYKVPRLVKGSVPSIFPWIEADASTETDAPLLAQANVLQLQSEKPKDNTVDRTDISPPPQKPQNVNGVNEENADSTLSAVVQEQPEVSLDCQENDTTGELAAEADETISNVPVTLDQLLATEIDPPPGWLMQETVCEGKKLIIFFTNKSVNVDKVYKTFVFKAVTVTNDLSVQITVLGELIDTKELNVPPRISDVTQLRGLLHMIDVMNVCNGCTSSLVDVEIKDMDCNTVSQDITSTWRDRQCSLLLPNATCCKSCRTTRKTLLRKLHRWKTGTTKKKRNVANSSTQKEIIITLREKLRAARLSKTKTVTKYNSVNEKLKLCEKKIARCENLDTERLLKIGKVSEKQICGL